MSSRDDRIVRMGFDNAKFESGASKTMSTLDKLNEKLKLKGASEGSEKLQKSLSRVDFSSMERGIAALEKRFSTMGIVGMNVINKISDSMINKVKNIEQATIGQIKSGGWARAMNIANAKFQIEGLGFDWAQIEESVNYGVKDTAYGLDAAASAASQLAASGVDFQKVIEKTNGKELTAMHKSLRAISGVAAMTNSSYEDIARIFTTVAGNGRLMGDQLLQLSSRGMNAAAKLAEVMGTTEEDIRTMVSKGQIDFQTFAFAMDNAFGEHAKEANKTFTGALGNMKAALSRVGEIFASPVINKTNTFFISLTGRIDELKNKMKSIKVPRTFDEISDKYKNLSANAAGYDEILKTVGEREVRFADDFAEMWQAGVDAFSAFVKAIDLGWFDKIVDKVDSVTIKLRDFFDLVKDYYADPVEEAAEAVNDATKSLKVSADEAKAAHDVIAGKFGYGDYQKNKLTELFGEQSAKNIQAYVESVKAAGWSYEKAQIKVADANEEAAKSEKKVIDEQKRAKFKMVMDAITTSLKNLWTVATNLAKAAKKISSAIFKAFAKVFNINTKTVTSGVTSLTEKLVKLSEKLIISDKAAEKVTNAFVKIFEAIKTGVKYTKKAIIFTKELFTQFKDSDAVELAKEKVSGFFESFKKTKVGQVLKDNPVGKLLGKFFDGIRYLLSDSADIPGKLVSFFNALVKKILEIDWKGVLNLAGIALIFASIARFFFSLNKIGKAIDAVAGIPVAIKSLLTNFGKAIKQGGKAMLRLATAESIKIIAESIVMVMAAIVAVSMLDQSAISRATAVFLAVGIAFMILMKSIKNLTKVSSLEKSVASSITAFTETMRFVGAAATMLLSIAASVVVVSVALAIIHKTGADTASNVVTLITIIAALTGVLFAVMKMFKDVKASKMIGYVAAFGAMSVFMAALSATLLTVTAMMLVLRNIPISAVAVISGSVSAILGMIAVIVKSLQKSNPTNLLSAAVTMVAVGASIGMIMNSLGATMIEIASAVAVLVASGVKEAKDIIGIVIAFFIGIIGSVFVLTKISKKAGDVKEAFARNGTIALVAAAFGSIGYAVNKIADAIATISKNCPSAALLKTVTTSIIAIVLAITAAIKITSKVKPLTLAIFAATFTSISAAMVLISAAISILSRVGGENMLKAAASLALALVGVGAAIALASASFTKNKNGALNIAVGMLSIAAVLLVIGHVFKQLSNIDELVKKAVVLGSLIAVIGGVVSLMTVAFSKNKNGGADTMLAVGGSFVLIAGAMVILAYAMKQLASVGSGITTAAIAFGIFVGVVGVLAGIAAIFPQFSAGLLAVGKAFLYTGVGAALVGAGFLLVAEAVKRLTPNLDKFFSVIEDHWLVAIGFAAFLVVMTSTILKFVDKLATVLVVVYEIIKDAFSSIGKLLKRGSKDAKEWVGKTQNKGKIAVIALITTLCSALVKTSPTIFNTLGTMLIKGLDFLAKMIPEVVDKLIVILVNLLYGLAKAISKNSGAIANAIRAVVESIITLIIEVVASLLDMVSGWVSGIPLLGSFVGGALDGLSSALRSSADSMTKDIERLSNDADTGIRKVSGGLGILDTAMGNSGSATSGLTSLLGDYASALGIATDGVNGLADAEANRANQLNTTHESFQEMYDSSTEAERKRYDEYAKLDDAAIDARVKYEETVQNAEYLRRKVDEAKAEYDAARLSESDPEAIKNAERAWLEWQELAGGSEQTVAKAAEKMQEAQSKADDYYEAHKALLEKLVEARNLQKEIFDIVNDPSRITSEYQEEALNLLSKAYFNQTGRHLESMDANEYTQRMKNSDLRDLYHDILASVVSEHEAAMEEAAEEIADQEMDVYTRAASKLEQELSRNPSTGALGKTFNYLLVDTIRDNADSPETSKNIEETADTFMGKFRDKLDRSGSRILKPAVNKTMTENVVDESNDVLGIISGSGTSTEGELLGSNYVLGIENGMNSVDINSFVDGYINDMNDTANAAAGVASPSKIMKETGKFVVLGLIEGLTDTTDKLDKAAGGLGSKTVQAFSEPLSYLSRIMDGELEYDPSIRPVVDSTGLSKSASTINAAFRNGTIDVGQFSGQLAADINSLKRNDNEIVTELQLLRDDIDAMTGEIANMQMVLDTGVLVGQISGSVDENLGRRMSFKKRRI